MLVDADGTNHGYTGNIYNYNYGGNSSTSFNGYTTDGTFIDYSCYVSTYNGITSMSASAKLPNGTNIAYSVNSLGDFSEIIYDHDVLKMLLLHFTCSVSHHFVDCSTNGQEFSMRVYRITLLQGQKPTANLWVLKTSFSVNMSF